MSVAWPRYAVEVQILVQRATSTDETLHGGVSDKNVQATGIAALGRAAPNSGKLRWHFSNGFARIRRRDMLTLGFRATPSFLIFDL